MEEKNIGNNTNGNGGNGGGKKKKPYYKKNWHRNNRKKDKTIENEVVEAENAALEEVVENDKAEVKSKEVVEDVIVDDEEIVDESQDNDATDKDVESLLKSVSHKMNMHDEDQEDRMVNKQVEEEELKITWPLYDSMKKELTPDFHRGCRLKAENYEVGSCVLRHSQCKLDSFNWLKDFEKEEAPKEGELLVAEVRFKNDRKDFFNYPAELKLVEGDIVAVEAAIGYDIGIVSMVGELVKNQRKRKKNTTPVAELKKICRRARANDIEKFIDSVRQEENTLYRSREIASGLRLDMKLNDIEYQGDRTKAIFYYTADGRVDFRELIKRLAEEFHVRVEMRQIGFRQESAKLGGIGSCGRELCCASWISEFQSVTTGVARVQQLSPNPQKLAGQCGKLKCCLNYEYETYVDALKAFPDNRVVLKTKKGDGYYQKIDIFKGLMWYSYPFDRNNMMAIPAEKVKEIITMNKKGEMPEQLEDFAFIKEQHNADYGDGGENADLSKLE